MVFVAIAAGGSGTRMGSDKPKQFIEILGKPILVHTIERFLCNKDVDIIYIGINAEWKAYFAEVLDKFLPNNEKIRLICGGVDRNETLKRIIYHIEENHSVNDDDILVTHDAVRPFVSDQIIQKNIEYATENGACGTYLSAVDTIAVSECGEFIKQIPNRRHMYQVQTPQSFRLTLLKHCFEEIGARASEYTDTCSVCNATGVKIRMIHGDSKNIKITTPFDLLLSKTIMEGYKS